MTILEIVLLIIGLALCIGSFFVSERLSEKDKDNLGKLTKDQIEEIIRDKMADAKVEMEDKLSATIDEAMNDLDLKTDKVIPKLCDKGYYIPDDDKTLQDCQKCSLEGCQKCNGTYKNNECSSCGNLSSIYYNNKIVKCISTCETGDEEKCLTCNTDKDECLNCNTGYKLVNGKCKPDYLINQSPQMSK